MYICIHGLGTHMCTNAVIFLESAALGQFSSLKKIRPAPGNRSCTALHMAFLGTGWPAASFACSSIPAHCLFLAPTGLSSFKIPGGCLSVQAERQKLSQLSAHVSICSIFCDMSMPLSKSFLTWQQASRLRAGRETETGPSHAFCSKKQGGGSREWAFTTGRKCVSTVLRILGA